MRSLLTALGLFVLSTGLVAGGDDKPGHAADAKHLAIKPDAIQWGPAPPSLPPGAKMAVLVGDPTKSGAPFVIRAKLPDGYKIAPHWHPHDENVTVLKGALLIGEGDTFDAAKLQELPAGSFMRMPKKMSHFATTKGETIIQLHGTEAFEVHYINAADDPRKKEEKK